DVAGPIVKRALEEKIGPGNHVEIGETRLGHNAAGQSVLSVHSIVIKSRDGDTIATAPRAEIVLDGGMLLGNFRAKRIDPIDAVRTLRSDEDGRIGITAGDPQKYRPAQPDKTASNPVAEGAAGTSQPAAGGKPPPVPFVYPELAAWL